MKYNCRLVPVLIFLLNFSFAFGWGKTGHRVVAEIAEQNLTAKAKKEIRKITANQPVAYWANYPDFIKSDPESYKNTFSWHYLNIPENLGREDFNDFLNQSSDEYLYKRVLILKEELKNRKNFSNEEQIRMLYFMVHLIGDAHQPLHLGREEDWGGNKIEVRWFGEKTNLHSLWDDKLVDFQKYSYTEYARILDYHDDKFNRKYTSGSLEDWLFDSYQQSAVIYAGVGNGDSLEYRYGYDYLNLMENQLLKAGLRLAKMLNEIFG